MRVQVLKSHDFSYAACANGTVKTVYYDPRPGNPLRGDKCFEACVREHEIYHQKQIAAWCPWMCKCYSNQTFDIGYTQFDGGKTRNIWECPAHVVLLLCLKKSLDAIAKGDNPNKCNQKALTDALEAEIRTLGQSCKINVPPYPAPPKDPPVYPP